MCTKTLGISGTLTFSISNFKPFKLEAPKFITEEIKVMTSKLYITGLAERIVSESWNNTDFTIKLTLLLGQTFTLEHVQKTRVCV
ncbi:hypothetical protein NECAME_00593 [Necator americanus]|uniref:Uncharacterized protein n=1 Tax=Necator americanus TaxID=51031 RepID=W2T2H5_NECAM|nr:hypothetical protein NECAME_00593 [Necator americanus]ETN75182.1 hypothetical protein NECAME_00593 [Necator americanus]